MVQSVENLKSIDFSEDGLSRRNHDSGVQIEGGGGGGGGGGGEEEDVYSEDEDHDGEQFKKVNFVDSMKEDMKSNHDESLSERPDVEINDERSEEADGRRKYNSNWGQLLHTGPNYSPSATTGQKEV
jgi:hypothetical protein